MWGSGMTLNTLQSINDCWGIPATTAASCFVIIASSMPMGCILDRWLTEHQTANFKDLTTLICVGETQVVFKTLLKFLSTANAGIAMSLILFLFVGASKFCLVCKFLQVYQDICLLVMSRGISFTEYAKYMDGDWLNLAQMSATKKMCTLVQTSCLKCSLQTASLIIHTGGPQPLHTHSS